jgi:uncharacterized ferritin-like protein (DUF455 family)
MDNLFVLAHLCLSETELDKKLFLSEVTARLILSGSTKNISIDFDFQLNKPGHPDKPLLVLPRDLPKRNIQTTEGRAALIHSIAHIEFNAINLAWDLICRFQDMPAEFYTDWAQVALEETKHFRLLQKNLNDLNYAYGDFPAHNGLWDIADKTSHDLLLRLAVVPRIMEARGLDVTPGLIDRFRSIKDDATCSLLQLILEEEIGHVNIGTKWYRYQCDKLNEDSEEKFKKIAEQFLPSNTSTNINHEARLMAGFSQSELDYITSH